MGEWALMKNGRIDRVVMASATQSEMRQKYPDYEIADLYSLPPAMQQQYQFWYERP